MKAIVLALIPILGVAVGVWLGRRNRGPLNQGEKKELVRLRRTVREIQVKAAEHAVLGDDFAVIVTGIIADSERES
jgi:hypothetical protein